MSELFAAIIGALVGALTSTFFAPLQWLAWAWMRKLVPVKPHNLLDVIFVSGPGENIYWTKDASKQEDDSLTSYTVRTHFRLRAKVPLNISNIEIFYPRLTSRVKDRKITLDGEAVQTDQNYNTAVPVALAKDRVLDVQLSTTFSAKVHETWDQDGGPIKVELEITTPLLNGFSRVIIAGTLAAGGQVTNASMTMEQGC